jgi:hypothetical protein
MMSKEKNIVKIKVDLILKNEEAEFFNFLCATNDKCKTFTNIKEMVEFLFKTGFSFIHGHVVGSALANQLNDETPFVFNFLGMKSQLSTTENNIKFNKIFYDGEPAEFKLSQDKQILQFRHRNTKQKNNWHSIYLLNNNKALQW